MSKLPKMTVAFTGTHSQKETLEAVRMSIRQSLFKLPRVFSDLLAKLKKNWKVILRTFRLTVYSPIFLFPSRPTPSRRRTTSGTAPRVTSCPASARRTRTRSRSSRRPSRSLPRRPNSSHNRHVAMLHFVQGCSKRWDPGCVKTRWKIILPAEGKQKVTFSPNFTQPEAHLLEHLCRSLSYDCPKPLEKCNS